MSGANLGGIGFFKLAEQGLDLPPRCPTCGHRRVVRFRLFEQAQHFAMRAFDVGHQALRRGDRAASHVEARAFLVWALRTLPPQPVSYQRIGQLLGGYEHSSVSHLHKKAINLRLRDTDFGRICQQFITQLDYEKEADHGRSA